MDKMLHEIEYIQPHACYGGKCLDTYLVGGLWVNPGIGASLDGARVEGKTVLMNGIPILEKPTVGGESGYGFGRLELTEDKTDCLGLSGWKAQEGGSTGLCIIPPDQTAPILAHVRYEPGQRYEGVLEPIVGREWDTDKGAGRFIAQGIVCIAPGGRCFSKAYEIDNRGFWSVID
jgi:hypothetical protein